MQCSDLCQTTLVSDAEEFFSFMFLRKHKVNYFDLLNDRTTIVQWSYSERCVMLPNRVKNVFIAIFTTAYVRLKLYSYLVQIQENVLYTDTNSLTTSWQMGRLA